MNKKISGILIIIVFVLFVVFTSCVMAVKSQSANKDEIETLVLEETSRFTETKKNREKNRTLADKIQNQFWISNTDASCLIEKWLVYDPTENVFVPGYGTIPSAEPDELVPFAYRVQFPTQDYYRGSQCLLRETKRQKDEILFEMTAELLGITKEEVRTLYSDGYEEGWVRKLAEMTEEEKKEYLERQEITTEEAEKQFWKEYWEIHPPIYLLEAMDAVYQMEEYRERIHKISEQKDLLALLDPDIEFLKKICDKVEDQLTERGFTILWDVYDEDFKYSLAWDKIAFVAVGPAKQVLELTDEMPRQLLYAYKEPKAIPYMYNCP